MKKLLKIVGLLILVFLLLVACTLGYLKFMLPNVPVQKDLVVEATPERVERGKYLANHVAVCIDCHSTRDFSLYSGPLKEGTVGKGGELFSQEMGFPGTFVAKNITPFALKDWSDGELYRVITSGVSKNGQPMFPVMPYPAYGKMATEDVYSIIAYLRTLTPVEHTPPASKAIFPVSFIMHSIPKPAQPETIPPVTDTLAYGKYVTNAAACIECHTKMDKGKPVGEPFAGGFVFPMPGGAKLTSSNITPDLATGIGAWTKEQFIARFKAFGKDSQPLAKVDMAKGEMQSIMPWSMYAGMTEQDLGAIYDYLKSLPPVKNQVQAWTPGAGS